MSPSSSLFDSVDKATDDPILRLPIVFAKEPNPHKVNLGVGSYKTAAGHSLLLDSVRKAEKRIAKERYPRDYLPMDGDPEFIAYALELIFGERGKTEKTIERIIGIQSIGGTGALSVAGYLFHKLGIETIYLSAPTWPNHFAVFQRCGLKVETYPYYNPVEHNIDVDALCATIKKMSSKSVILLQSSCHNPTGFDLTNEQWKVICTAIKQQGIVPLFDFAYHGFGIGLDEDSWPIHYFLEQGLEFFVAYSFSKNFGLYGERVGLLAGVFNSKTAAVNIRSHLKKIIRSLYSSPPAHGAKVISTILGNKRLKSMWEQDLARMRDRIKGMRKDLAKEFAARDKNTDFSFITEQNGLFSYLGLTEENSKTLIDQYAIYLPNNGRINIAGVNKHNIGYVADSILAVLTANKIGYSKNKEAGGSKQDLIHA